MHSQNAACAVLLVLAGPACGDPALYGSIGNVVASEASPGEPPRRGGAEAGAPSEAGPAEASVVLPAAPWGGESCFYGAPTGVAPPQCPAGGTWVECSPPEGGSYQGMCDGSRLACHASPAQPGLYVCPAGTLSATEQCKLQVQPIAEWPSTYEYLCAAGHDPVDG
jgi:hypothetical protein